MCERVKGVDIFIPFAGATNIFTVGIISIYQSLYLLSNLLK
jgi:hypothetical protein